MQDRDRSDRERPVEGQIRDPPDDADHDIENELVAGHMREAAGRHHQHRQGDQRAEVKPEHDAQGADATGGERRKIVRQPPREGGAQAERYAH